ncbi:MAG: radical SAM protein [Rhodospirillales bacterium]
MNANLKIHRVLIVVPPLVDYDSELEQRSGKPDFEKRRLVSPIEPMTCAADLLDRGYEVKVFDLGTCETVRERRAAYRDAVENFSPDAVAVVQSILTFATASDWDGSFAFDTAREFQPNVVTILTGTHATNYPGQAVNDGIADYSVRGEVDLVIGDLLDTINNGDSLSDVAGLSFRNGSGVENSPIYPTVEIEDLPLPAYQLLDDWHHTQYARVLERGKIRYPEKSPHYRDIMTSRSCVLRCSFCSVAHLRGNRQKHRRKSLNQVFAEIDQALDDGIEEIHFFDDLFAETPEQIIDFTNEFVRRGYKFPWFVAQGMNLWSLNDEALSAMAETGMYRLIAPLESGSDRVLREVVGKIHSSVDHHHNMVVAAHKLGMEVIGMYVVGMMGETRDEVLETMTFAETHPEIDYSVFSIATPMIGTRLTKKIHQAGHLEDTLAVNKVIKRTVALYRTEEFREYELGIIRTFDWDRINFSTPERRAKYAGMVGVSLEELDQLREHSKQTFFSYFPDYDGPLSFKDLHGQPELYANLQPVIPDTLY